MVRTLRGVGALIMIMTVFVASAELASAQENDGDGPPTIGSLLDGGVHRVLNGHDITYSCSSGEAGPNDFLSADTDSDYDGVVDADDAFPFNGSEQKDTDGDCYGDFNDRFPHNPLLWSDIDSDGIADLYDHDDGFYDGEPGEYAHCTLGWAVNPARLADLDADSDGVIDAEDAFPWNPDASLDADGDCIADDLVVASTEDPAVFEQQAAPCTEGADFSEDRSADTDQDGDGWVDSEDLYPLNPDEFEDSDGDCVANFVDAFPDDRLDWADADQDGAGDNVDAFPLDALEYRDTDGDGIGDALDPDDDNDGWNDNEDEFPWDATEWLDSDGSGVGDNADFDDDDDWFDDIDDAFPLDPTEWLDTDRDGIGDNADLDDDNDGWNDDEDADPQDPSVWEQRDSAAAAFETLKTGDPELDAILEELLAGGDPYGSSSLSSSGYGSSSLYNDYRPVTYPSSNNSSGPSLRAIKWLILLPLLFVRWAIRSGDK